MLIFLREMLSAAGQSWNKNGPLPETGVLILEKQSGKTQSGQTDFVVCECSSAKCFSLSQLLKNKNFHVMSCKKPSFT